MFVGVRLDWPSKETPEFDTLLELCLQAKHETQQLKPLNLKGSRSFQNFLASFFTVIVFHKGE